jgi:hypothetical protein
MLIQAEVTLPNAKKCYESVKLSLILVFWVVALYRVVGKYQHFFISVGGWSMFLLQFVIYLQV